MVYIEIQTKAIKLAQMIRLVETKELSNPGYPINKIEVYIICSKEQHQIQRSFELFIYQLLERSLRRPYYDIMKTKSGHVVGQKGIDTIVYKDWFDR